MGIKKGVVALMLLGSATGVQAHCPLCTIGAGAAAGGALWLGVDLLVVALFVGGFAASTGWWISRLIKKEYIRHQKMLIIIASFILTIVPLIPLFEGITPLYISWFGEYGSWFNRTYLLNTFLLGSIVGGAFVSLTPYLSQKMTSWRRKQIPFQGIIITLVGLLGMGVLLQWGF
ncbi:MAG: hypothetical protein QT02_C0004G0052 [archaeon GW2011_AR9]|nr:MAG: hypothetical protein QT02_C0004G0052 [archaeon GW2011_AR9]MBS3120378.1 hypothetical protein [Candidatus Woesearchaeota archaeon]HIH13155.1 hypothetical protein [Candidatus Woesearchaeota archaeon]